MSQNSIDSPFSHSPDVITSQPIHAINRRSKSGWIIGGIVTIFLLSAVAYLSIRYLNDPFRQLEPFPSSSYFEAYQPLAGLKFRADLRVDADLGWKEGGGRLMAFTPVGENRQLVVFIPPELSNVFFNKGQTYTTELQVKEGGLLHASACRKN